MRAPANPPLRRATRRTFRVPWPLPPRRRRGEIFAAHRSADRQAHRSSKVQTLRASRRFHDAALRSVSMAAPRSSAAHASVVVLKLRDFARKAVAEQAALKAKLEAAIAGALGPLAEDERIVLETGSGAAVVVLGNPRGALDFAARAAGAGGGADIAAGIHHGPV